MKTGIVQDTCDHVYFIYLFFNVINKKQQKSILINK